MAPHIRVYCLIMCALHPFSVMTDINYHIPALLPEAIEALDIHPDGVYADVTFGGGGHSRAILAELDDNGHLYGFDRDIDAKVNAPDDPRFTFVHSDFRFIRNFMRYYGVENLDGILADLGVSFHHFDDASRGFSFRADAPLDMRMNRNANLSARDILNDYDEKRLTDLFRAFTDLKRPHLLAKAIADARAKTPLETTFQLADAVRKVINPAREKKNLAQVFQAVRIEVNHELDALRDLLSESTKALRQGGRLAVITYHSIEDRIVKNFMKTGNFEGVEQKDFFGRVESPWRLITRSPITPSDAEIELNPRSRSAKLRVAQKL